MKTKIVIASILISLLCSCSATTPPRSTATPTATATETPTPTMDASNRVAPLSDIPVEDDCYILYLAELGLTFGVPYSYVDGQTMLLSYVTEEETVTPTPADDGITVIYIPAGTWGEYQAILGESPTAEQTEAAKEFAAKEFRELFSIKIYSEEKWNEWILAGKTAADITSSMTNAELGTADGLIYLLTENEVKPEGLSDEAKALYAEILLCMPIMRDKIVISERTSHLSGTFPSFEASDLFGNEVNSDFINNNKLTMINFWATFCGPCITEMPMLGEMGREMPEGTMLVGVVCDAIYEENVPLGIEIVTDSNVDFLNIIPDDVLNDFLYINIEAYPTTLFIDSDGNIVGDPLVGSRSREEYEAELQLRLEALETR